MQRSFIKHFTFCLAKSLAICKMGLSPYITLVFIVHVRNSIPFGCTFFLLFHLCCQWDIRCPIFVLFWLYSSWLKAHLHKARTRSFSRPYECGDTIDLWPHIYNVSLSLLDDFFVFWNTINQVLQLLELH